MGAAGLPPRRCTRLAALLVLLAVGGLAPTGCDGGEKQTVTVTEQVTTTEEADTVATEATTTEASSVDVIGHASRGVVQIITSECDGRGAGTGFLVGRHLVATAQHVVAGATAIQLKKHGKVVADGATVVGADSFQDVALLDAGQPVKGSVLAFSDEKPRLGDEVAVLGFPLHWDYPTFDITVSRGAVSGLDRTIPIDGVERTNLIQTDADINPGNSGGPIISTESGGVVAIADAGLLNSPAEFSWGIKASVAASMLEAWRTSPQPEPAADCTGVGETSFAKFSGAFFSIAYPESWSVEAGEKSKGTYLDTTIRDPDDQALMIRVDVQPDAAESDPVAVAEQVEETLKPQSRYQRISLEPTDFHGYPAATWGFIVEEDGVLLRKTDVFFVSDAGTLFAVLTQAPVGKHEDWIGVLDAVRDSLVVRGD
jgi:hypothetical protein